MQSMITSIRSAVRGSTMIVLVLLAAVSAWPVSAAAATQTADTARTSMRGGKPSAVKRVARKLADTLATVGAAKAVDTLLGGTGKAVGQMMGAGQADPCAHGGANPGVATAGTKLVGIAKTAGAAPDADPASATPVAPCPQPMPDGTAAMMGARPGASASGMPGGMASTVMMATPLGIAVTAAPLAAAGVGAAAKGVKKLLGGGPMTATAMLKQIQEKGRLVLRGVRFVAHTEVFDEGYETTLSTLAEALAQVPGPFALHVEPEADKGEEPDAELAAKRVAKVWATLVAAGVPSTVFIDGAVVPDSLVTGRKPAKPGSAAVELWKIEARP